MLLQEQQTLQDHYIACLDLKGRDCLVVGGGNVGHEKITGLLACGAHVTVVAPEISDEVAALPVEILQREYRASDLDGRRLVIAATSLEEVNRRVYADAEERNLFCNVADVPELCSFILPAVHRHGPIVVSVSTGGASPALAQWLRDSFAAQIGEQHEALAHELRSRRPWAKENLGTYEERRDYFQQLVTEALG
jgi:precorrin-2 dehydrogenase / sirohydrochlorin ferrochelatase